MKRLAAAFCVLFLAVAVFPGPVKAQAATNTINVSGTYDFTVNNACSATVLTQCVKQFNVYDVTSATPVKLGSITAPSGANTATAAVAGSFTIPALVAGIRSFSFTAQMADGTESDPKAPTATSSTTVRPGVPVNLKFSLTAP